MTNQQYLSRVLWGLNAEEFWEVFKNIEEFSKRYNNSREFINLWLSDEYNPTSIVYKCIGLNDNNKMIPCDLCIHKSEPERVSRQYCRLCPAR